MAHPRSGLNAADALAMVRLRHEDLHANHADLAMLLRSRRLDAFEQVVTQQAGRPVFQPPRGRLPSIRRACRMYPWDAVPGFTCRDWVRHSGDAWPLLRHAKRQYDPAGLLGPGPGIFSAN